MKMRRRRDFSVRKAWRFAEKALTLHAKTNFFNLQGRVKFPIGGYSPQAPRGRTVETAVPTVTVWMKEEHHEKNNTRIAGRIRRSDSRRRQGR